MKTVKGFNSVEVKIVGEEVGYYFVEKYKELEGEIATTSVAILKNMLGEGDE